MGFLGSCRRGHFLLLQTVTVDLTLTLTLTESRSTTETPGDSGSAKCGQAGCGRSAASDGISSRKLRNGGAASRHANRKQKEKRRLGRDAPDVPSAKKRRSGGRPVDERVPHAGGDGGGLRRVAQSEDALDDRQLSAGGLQAAEGAPVVDHHPRRNHLAAPVDGSRLDTRASTTVPKRLLTGRAGCNSGTHHQGDLQERGQLVLVLYGRLWVKQASLVAEGAVGAHQDLLRHRLTEHLHLQRVGQDLLRFLGEDTPTGFRRRSRQSRVT